MTETALRTAKAVVVLWSPRSVASRWVRAEATLADRNKTLVPCTIEPCDRPIMFELTQTAELSHWQGDARDKAWEAFLGDVRRFVEARPALAAPLVVKETLREIIAEPANPPETLLAVLPFDNLSSDAEMQFFSDGVSEDILGRIMRGSKLKVISRTSSFQFRGADKPKAAAALNATHVVDGSIRRAGGKVRIAAYLTEAATQQTLWTDRYDRSLDDIFAVQDEISESIAAALDTAFFPAKKAAIDPAIYDLYLRAREFETDPDRLARNLATLESVTEMAPEFAEGWVALANALQASSLVMPYAERRPINVLTTAALAQGLALDPDSSEAASAEWSLCNPFGDYLAQEKAARRAQEKGQNSASAQFTLSYHFEVVGRNREAVEVARRARDLNPKHIRASFMQAQTLWQAGRYAEGRAAMEAHLQAWPDDQQAAVVLILTYVHQKDWAGLDALIDPQRLEQFPLREHSRFVGRIALLRSPDPENRRLILEWMRSNVEKTGHLEPGAMVWPAVAGFADEAFDILDGAKLGPSGGPRDSLGVNAYRSHLLFPAAYPELRANPRFVKLCARLGLVEYWLETQKWPDCAAEVPYDFRAECEAYRDYPKDEFFA